MNGSLVQISEHEQTSKQQKRNLDRNFLKKATKTLICNHKKVQNKIVLQMLILNYKLENLIIYIPFGKIKITNNKGSLLKNQQQIIWKEILQNFNRNRGLDEKVFQSRTYMIRIIYLQNTCRKILSVDDEVFNQKSIQCLLKQKGLDFILAYNGQKQYNQQLKNQKCSSTCQLFLLILMDYQMPIMNGIETTFNLKQMMKQKEIQNIDIIGLTAFSSKNDVESCLKSGMMEVPTKPLVIAEFYIILQQI